MADLQKEDRPDYKCAAWQRMSEPQQIVRDVEKGTLALRQQTTSVNRMTQGKVSVSKYLPIFPAEHPDDYRDRVAKATHFNAYARTKAALVGMAFKKNPVLHDDVPEIIRGRAEVRDETTGDLKQPKAEGHAENIDLAGTHFDVFAREAFDHAFEGHVFILVDMQQSLGPGATLEDEQRAGLRPYWVEYKAGQASNFRPIVINGQREIGQITFEEKVSVPAGEYGEKEVMRYRTFKLEPYESGHRVRSEIKEKQTDANGGESFVTVGEPTYVRGFGGKYFDRIPLGIIYGQKTGFLESQPPLLDLAFLNISYFQKKSDRDQSLHKCGNPIPIFPAFDPDKPILKAGSGIGIITPSVESKPYYMEPEGNALEESREDLKELRGEMATLGLTMIAGRTQQAEATATEAVLDFTQESSELETMARSAQDCFELCLGFHARYLGGKSGGSLSLGSHLKSLRLTQAMIQVYSNMAAASQLSLLTLWDIMERADALPDTFDAKTEQERLKDQQKSLGDSLLKDFDKGGDPVIA